MPFSGRPKIPILELPGINQNVTYRLTEQNCGSFITRSILIRYTKLFFKYPPQGSDHFRVTIALPCPFLKTVLERYSKTLVCGSLPIGEPARG